MNFKRWRGWIGDLSSRAWLNYILLLLITLIAAALRLYELGQWSFWIDEIYTINHAVLHFGNLQLILANTPPARNWVPVSAILAAQALSTWGVNEWSARVASAAIGILTFPILYFPTSRIFGHRITLISLLLLAVSPWHIFWSQNARFYTSLMLFYTLALFAFYVGIEKDRPIYLWLFLILVYLAASERLSALFIYPVVAAYLAALWVLRVEKPKGVNFKNLLLIASPILIGSAIEVYSRVVSGESRFFADFTWFFQYRV
ncbi:MAG TPA: glycosyltransferase family 39 protein, partial [Candidatus Paceibacterota bacterium]